MRRSGTGHLGWRLAAACCAVMASVWLAAPASAGAAARASSAPRSCGRAVSAAQAARARGAAPTLTLTPSHGAPGTMIVARGSGWPQGKPVTITAQANGQGIASQPASSATVQADGTFSLALAAPTATCFFTPQVGQVVRLVATTVDGSATARADFTFDVPAPTLTAPPDRGQTVPGAIKLPVRGTNWGAGTSVTVWTTTLSTPANAQNPWLPPAGVPDVVLTADAGGQIAGEVPLPARLLPLRPGAWLGLAASATSPSYGQVVTYLPSAYHVGLAEPPTLVASLATAAQGDALRLSGDHWWPGDTVRLMYCQGAPQPAKASTVRCNPAQSVALGTAQVDPAGHFAVTVNLPAGTPTGVGMLEASVTGDFDDPFTATLPLRVTATANMGAWLASALGPATPLVALALLALASLLAALWWIAQRRVAARATERS